MPKIAIPVMTVCALLSAGAIASSPAEAASARNAPPLRPATERGESARQSSVQDRAYVNALQAQASAAAVTTLSYAQVEGWWIAAGGSTSTASTAAAISQAESARIPGIIQQGQPYSTTGWGLWQLTPGNSVPKYGVDFQLLDPWNNAEAAISKYKAAGGFSPWTTYNNGAYKQFLQNVAPQAPTTDPGQYAPDGSAPSGSTGSSKPGTTYGPPLTASAASSPSLAFAPGRTGNPIVAFRASGTDNKMWTWNGALNTVGNGTASADGVAAGTSPSIAVLPNGNLVVAFHASGDDKLWIWTGAPNTTGNGTPTADGMAPGTSPSLALTSTGVPVVAFHASGDNKLWIWTGALNTGGNGTATADGMATGTSPSLALTSTNTPVVAFHASGADKLWTWTGALNTGGNGTATADGMATGTSPSLALTASNTPVVAFHASGDNLLWTWTGALNTGGNGTATADGMA